MNTLPAPHEDTAKKLSRNQIVCLGFTLSMCSIIYELLIAKTVAKLAGSVIMWESVTIGIYVGSLGLGVYFFSRKQRQVIAALFSIELLLAAAGSLCVVMIFFLHIVYRIYIYDAGMLRDYVAFSPIYYFGFTSQLVTLVVGFLSGMELPALLHFADNLEGRNRTNLVLGIYYLGALIGTLLFGLVFLPHIKVIHVAIITALINFAVCLYLAWLLRRSPGWIRFATTGLVVAILVLAAWYSPMVSKFQIKNYYYNRFLWVTDNQGIIHYSERAGLTDLKKYLDAQPDISRIKSPIQYIDIVPVRNEIVLSKWWGKRQADEFYLYMDGHFQVYSRNEGEYHEHLAHIPILVHRRVPAKVLILGGGDGLLVREILRYGDKVDKIRLVEIDAKVIELAKTHPKILELNTNSLADPKVEVIIDDAFRWLRWNREQYDAIYIDFPYPFNYDVLRLYSVEFATMVGKRLAPGGFAAIDAPIEVEEEVRFNSILYNTLAAAGFKTTIGFQSKLETFATFTVEKIEPQFSFTDLGIRFHHIPYNYFDHGNWRIFAGTRDPKLVNSILKPILSGVEDKAF